MLDAHRPLRPPDHAPLHVRLPLTEVLPSPLDFIPAGRFNGVTYLLGGQSAGPTTAIELFNKFISTHPNIFMVHCGHVDAEFKMVDANKAGLPVYQTLVDFKTWPKAAAAGCACCTQAWAAARRGVDGLHRDGELRDNGDGFEHSIAIVEYYKNAYGDYIKQLGLDMDMLKLLESIKALGLTVTPTMSRLWPAHATHATACR